MSDPPFKSVAILGIGLIGGSIALGVRERWPSARIVGIDRQAILAHAIGSGAVDRGAADASGIGDVDLVVLAAPVRDNVGLLAEVAPRFTARTVVTDVGGTKRDITDAARLLSLSTPFVGGHPIGGAERGGFGFARADLFRGRPWIFTPASDTDPAVLDRLFAFASGLGAKPSTMDPAAHDRLMAFLSHLPQLTASALMDAIGHTAGADGLALAGRGLVDTTRLASSPPDTWRDVCATNADAIADALDALIARLTELRSDLHGGTALTRIFDDAARWRAVLMNDRDPSS